MAANLDLQVLEEQGWRQGFANMARKEFSLWWSTHRWWKQLLLWTLIPNLMNLLISYVENVERGMTGLDLLEPTVTIFFSALALATGIGGIVLMQDTIIGERQSGTAEWILSKPVSRRAFVLAKLLAHGSSFTLLGVLVPCLVGYLQMTFWSGMFPPVFPFLILVLLSVLHALFYVALTLMLGTMAQARGSILGVSLVVLFAGQIVPMILSFTVKVTPWKMVELAAMLAFNGGPLSLIALPAVMTFLWSILFTILAVRKFVSSDI